MGRALERAGYETWPARSVSAAESLLCELSLFVDVLVINASLPRAREFTIRVGRSREDCKVISICEGSDGIQAFSGACAVHRKPQALSAATELEWVQIIRSVQPAEVVRRELQVLRRPTDCAR